MNPTIRTLCLSLAAALATFALPPAAADAQLRVIPQAGLYAPVSDLGTVSTVEGARTVGDRDASFAYGLSAELGSGDGTTVRLTAMYGSDSEVPVGGVGCVGDACRLQTTVLNATASVVLRPLPRIILVQPYLLAGGGLKRYGFDPRGDEALRSAFDDESKVTGALGVGLDWTLGVLSGTLEVTDYVSGAVLDEEGDAQHDFFVTVGLHLG